MLQNGYSLILDADYNYITKYSDLTNYKNSFCTLNSFLCLGGGPNGSDLIRVIACATCSDVLTDTVKNSPVFHGLAYWYKTDTCSVGFAPNGIINQNSGDVYNMTDELRLSWHLASAGGYRAGTLAYPGQYRKYVFIKDSSNRKFCSVNTDCFTDKEVCTNAVCV